MTDRLLVGCPKPHECTSQFLDPVKDDAGKPVNVFLAASRPRAFKNEVQHTFFHTICLALQMVSYNLNIFSDDYLFYLQRAATHHR